MGQFDIGGESPFKKIDGTALFDTGKSSAFDIAAKGGMFEKQEEVADPFSALDEALEGETVEQYPARVYTLAEQEFRARTKRENERMLDAIDTEFWFAVCFQTRKQKVQFLELAKLINLGAKYLDGWEVAKILGITLDPVEKKYNTSEQVDKKLAALARPLNGE